MCLCTVLLCRYLGGVLDFTGELNRWAILKATLRDKAAVERARDVVDAIMGRFLEVGQRTETAFAMEWPRTRRTLLVLGSMHLSSFCMFSWPSIFGPPPLLSLAGSQACHFPPIPLKIVIAFQNCKKE